MRAEYSPCSRLDSAPAASAEFDGQPQPRASTRSHEASENARRLSDGSQQPTRRSTRCARQPSAAWRMKPGTHEQPWPTMADRQPQPRAFNTKPRSLGERTDATGWLAAAGSPVGALRAPAFGWMADETGQPRTALNTVAARGCPLSSATCRPSMTDHSPTSSHQGSVLSVRWQAGEGTCEQPHNSQLFACVLTRLTRRPKAGPREARPDTRAASKRLVLRAFSESPWLRVEAFDCGCRR
jgi:hypothetical protein